MSHDDDRFELEPAPGARLRGVCRGEPGCPCVVYSHGLGSDRLGEKAAALEAECLRRGWGFAALNFRGHGDSDGRLEDVTCTSLLEDLHAVCDLAVERGCSALFLFGSSMGGWAAAWHAALRPGTVAACAVVAPALRFPELHLRSHDYPPEELASRLQTPLLVFHGMEDDVVPYRDSVELAARCSACGVEVRLYAGGDHRLNRLKADLARSACEFFAARIPPS